MDEFTLSEGCGFVSKTNGGTEPVPAPEPTEEIAPLHPGLHKVPPEQIAVWLQEGRAKRGTRSQPATTELDPDPLPPGFHRVPPEQIAAWRAEMENSGRARLPAKGRPTITVVAGNQPAIVDQAEGALVKANTDIYQRGTMLVRPATVTIKISDGRETTAQQLVPINLYGLVEEFSRAAHWQKMGEKESYPIDCPSVVAKMYLARAGFWRLPVLTGIINCPTLREDGSILDQPGHDARTGLLFDPQGCQFLPVADAPSKADAREALWVLRELIKTFPFVDNAAQSVALSAILTAPVRRTLASAPLHGFSAPVAASGKSKLVDIASLIATGHEAAVIEEGNEDELPKRLGAALLAGTAVISIDNVERGALGGGFLCQILTQPYLNIRILGYSENCVICPDTFLCATGNNLRFAGDMTRRALMCTIDPGCERAELREFSCDPIDLVKTDRPKYVHAALTILRAYHVAGHPQNVSACGSFETWSKLVRAALVWLGEEDPWMTTEAVRGGDPKLEALTAVIAQWRNAIGAEPVTVRELIEKATQRRPSTGIFDKEEFLYPDLREALLTVAGRGGAINGQALGNWLGRNQGRIVAGSKLERRGIVKGNATWGLSKA